MILTLATGVCCWFEPCPGLLAGGAGGDVASDAMPCPSDLGMSVSCARGGRAHVT